MTTDLRTRKRYFHAALALSDMTVVAFARLQGVGPKHVYAVLAGRESGRLEAEIDAFIAAWLPEYTQLPIWRNAEDEP